MIEDEQISQFLSQETRQYLVWDRQGEENTVDEVATTLFEAAEKGGEDSGSAKSGRKKKDKKKKKSAKKGAKGKKNKKKKMSSSSSQSSKSSSESEESEESSKSSDSSSEGRVLVSVMYPLEWLIVAQVSQVCYEDIFSNLH